MPVYDPKALPERELYQLLIGTVAPRPIAFVSTLDANGVPNLAPYSYFNVFSSNPPVVVFSSNRKTPEPGKKDTLKNVEETGEAVINMVNHAIVRQMAVSSIAYPPEVNEFEKAGLTPLASEVVAPFRVKESPAQLECRVKQIIPLGTGSGAGHLIICEVLRLHIAEEVFDDKGRIDPQRMDLMGRLGRTFYVRASGEAVHSIYQATDRPGIGFDQLPPSALQSKILSGNDLGQVAGMDHIPTREDLEQLKSDVEVSKRLAAANPVQELHLLAKEMLAMENLTVGAQLLWLADSL